MFPATRITNRSPRPWAKTVWTGTRESEAPRMAANGCWPAVSSRRRVWLVGVSRPRTSDTKRWFPSRSRWRASRAGIMNPHPRPLSRRHLGRARLHLLLRKVLLQDLQLRHSRGIDRAYPHARDLHRGRVVGHLRVFYTAPFQLCLVLVRQIGVPERAQRNRKAQRAVA